MYACPVPRSRRYVLDVLAPTLESAAAALACKLESTLRGAEGGASGGGALGGDGSGGGAPRVRVQCFPRLLELRLVDALRARGFEPDPRAACVACAAYLYGAIAVGVADGGGAFAEAVAATSHEAVMARTPNPHSYPPPLLPPTTHPHH